MHSEFIYYALDFILPNVKPGPQLYKQVVFVIKKLNTPGGCSRQAIIKGMKSEFGEVAPHALKTALKKGTETTVLIQEGQRWLVKGHEPPPPSPSETVVSEDIKIGGGAVALSGSQCTMSYTGFLKNGTKFDSASKFTFTIDGGEVIKGWDKGIKGIKVGGHRKLLVPSKLGYGKRGSPPEIPGDADLTFDVKLLAVKN